MELTIDLMASESASTTYKLIGKTKIGVHDTTSHRRAMADLKSVGAQLVRSIAMVKKLGDTKPDSKEARGRLALSKKRITLGKSRVKRLLAELGLSGFKYKGGLTVERTTASKTIPKGVYTIAIDTKATKGKFCVEELEFFGGNTNDKSEIQRFVGPKILLVNYNRHGINGAPEATLVGDKSDLEQVLRKYIKGSGSDDISGYEIKPYKTK
jgi:hypothetical protein